MKVIKRIFSTTILAVSLSGIAMVASAAPVVLPAPKASTTMNSLLAQNEPNSAPSAAQKMPITTPPASSDVTSSDVAPLPGATFVDDGTKAPLVSTTEQQSASPNLLGNTATGRQAFAQMVRNLMPLNPTQIVSLRNMFDQSQRAIAEYPGVPPKPTSSSVMVNMSPGAAPPVIRLRAGYVTSLVFLDSSGQPWPVTGYDLGNPKAFNIQPTAPDGKGDMLIVQALDRYKQGNLAVMLKGENTPVMLTLMPGQRAVDYRMDLRMPGLGPNAAANISGLPQAADPLLMDFLDGVTPQGAKLISVSGAPAQVWLFQNRLFLRTRVTVLSPGWIQSMNSPDGTHVYELEKTPVVLASQRGEMIQLSIKGY